MKYILSEKALLFFGIFLLLANLGFQISKKRIDTAQQPIAPTQQFSASKGQITQLWNAALLAQYLHWDKTLTVTGEDNKSVKLNTILGATNKLVFRFSELSCSACVDREIDNLKGIAAEIGNDNIIILTTYENIRDLLVFKRINKLNFKVYNIAADQLPADKAGGTFIFVANAQTGAIMPFIPDKEDGALSMDYYKFIMPLFRPQII